MIRIMTLKLKFKPFITEHKGNYGYRRMTLELRNRGIVINHKRGSTSYESTWFNR